VIPTDIADSAQVETAATQVEAELGPIDVWINDAMTTVFSPFKDMTPEEFKRVTEVTYLGVVYGTMSALRRMLPRDRGVIVQVGSALAAAASRCSRRTAAPSTRSAAAPTRSAPS
jgi:NAD(P)-dependent dehydrogenase (short-subunit alcohol dehydrogenase family)